MTTAKRKLSEFGGASNGGGIEGVLKAAIDGVDEGGTLVFDAFRFEGNLTSSFEYAVFSPVIINKSILIEGETSDIRLVNKTAESPTFIVQPNKNQFFFGVENIKFISGSRAIEITGTNTLSPNSRIYNVSFISQSVSSVRVTTPEANLHLENVHIQGSPQFGLIVENSKNHLNLSIDKCKIENTTIAAIYINNTDLNSGSVYINDSELNDNNQAIVVNNVRYYEHNIEYFQNQANYILSGSSIRLTGSAGGGGGGGVTDHGLLTGLADDDHKQYLPISGTRGMSGSLNMNGHDITNVGNVDGVDVSTLDATLDAHILDVNNPHSTKFSNLVPETLANLNSAISDDDVLGISIFRPFSASVQSATASLQSATASLQSATASLQTFTASILPASSSWESRIIILTNASGTFRSELDTLFNVSASFRSELNFLKSATSSLESATASLQVATASLQTVSASLLAASSTFRTELTALTSSIDRLTSASSSVEARFVTLFNASGTFRAELNSQTASINLLTAFSNSHASRHLSGGLDPIDAQSLRANGIAANRVLISDGLGGWTTVLSSAFGGGGGGPHASTHLSGGSDPIDAHLLRANGIGINRVLIADGIGGWITVLSSAIGVYDHGGLNGLADDDHPQYTLRTDFNPFSASIQSATASLQSATASLQSSTASLQSVSASLLAMSSSYNTLSATYYPISASYNIVSASYTSFSASLNSASASWESRLLVLTNASATFRNELNSLTNSVVRLDAASGTFRAELNSQTASINLLTEFSNSHASRHLSGAADPIDIQLLRANAQPVGTLFAANSIGGISTIHSGVFLLTSSYQGFTASYQTFTASIQSTTASLQSATASIQSTTASLQTVSASLLAMSSSYNVLSATYYPVSSSYNTISASYIAFSASLNSASASWESRLLVLTNASATFRNELNSQTASINLLTAFSNSHAARHLSGAADPIDAQLLRANGIAVNRLLISDGLGGWTTVLSSAVGGGGVGGPHASTHLSGGSDQISAQDLAANGLASNRVMITNADGGWTTITSATLKSPVCLVEGFSTSSYYQVSNLTQSVDFSVAVFARQYDWDSSQTSRALISNLANEFIGPGFALISDSIRPVAKITDGSSTVLSNFVGDGWNHGANGQLFVLHFVKSGSMRSIYLNGESVYEADMGTTVYGSGTQPMWLGAATGTWGQGWNGGIGGWAYKKNYLSASQVRKSSRLIMEFSRINEGTTGFEHVWSIDGQTTVPTLLTDIGTSGSAHASLTGTLTLDCSIIRSFLSSIKSFSDFPNAHASTHSSGSTDPLNAQDLGASGIAPNRILISNNNGGWTTVESSSLPGVPSSVLSVLNNTASLWLRYDLSLSGNAGQIMYWGDQTSNLNHATHSISSSSPSYRATQGLFFDGTDDRLRVKDATSLDSTTEMFLAFRAKPDILNSSRAWLAKSNSGGGSWSIQESSEYRMWIGTPGVNGIAYPQAVAPAGSWHTYVFIFSGSGAGNVERLRARVDGVDISGSFFGTIPSTITAGTDDLTIGSYGNNIQYFSGTMREIVLSNMIPTPQQILDIEKLLTYGPTVVQSHASTHISGGTDYINAQDLSAFGIAPNQLLISNMSGGWTTIASSSVGGGGGGITNILSATNEGRTLISGVFGNTAYLKTIKSLTSSVEGTQLSDTSPIILSSTNDTIYFKRRPASLSQYFFDDFIGAVVTAAGFAWTFAAGGTGGGIAVQDIDTSNFTDIYGNAIGAVYIDTGTTAAGGCILRQNPTAFSMRRMTGSSIEWRAAITGAYQAGTNEFRINLGWCDTITTASRRPTNGIFFEHTGTNAGFWNIVAVSSSAVTVYNTGIPIRTTGSYQSFKIETIQSPLNTFTSTFYIDNVVVGRISTSIPNRRNQSVGPTAMISKEIGTAERGLIIDWCEMFYEIYREPV